MPKSKRTIPNYGKVIPDDVHPGNSAQAGQPRSSTDAEFVSLAITHSDAVVQFGARLLVIGEMLRAVLPELSPERRSAISRSFEVRVDAGLAAVEDVALPNSYHSALLSEINLFIQCLER